MCSWSNECIRFLDTLRASGNTIDCVLIADGLDPDFAGYLSGKYHVQFDLVTLEKDFWTKEPYGFGIWPYFKKWFDKEPETRWIKCDVKDVVVQGLIPELNITPYKVVVQTELKKISQCSWNTGWMGKDPWKDVNIVSAGCMAGLGFTLSILAEEIIRNPHNATADQGAYMHFIQDYYSWVWHDAPYLWTACQDNFGDHRLSGQIYNKVGLNTPIMHFCGGSKNILNKIYPLDNTFRYAQQVAKLSNWAQKVKRQLNYP